jgi:hypothetical protein
MCFVLNLMCKGYIGQLDVMWKNNKICEKQGLIVLIEDIPLCLNSKSKTNCLKLL